MNKANDSPCCFCGGKTDLDGKIRKCYECGMVNDSHVAFVMSKMTPYARANMIGYFHAMGGWEYKWMLPELSRSELRGYARGYLSVPAHKGAAQYTNLWLYGTQAKRDASWWGW